MPGSGKGRDDSAGQGQSSSAARGGVGAAGVPGAARGGTAGVRRVRAAVREYALVVQAFDARVQDLRARARARTIGGHTAERLQGVAFLRVIYSLTDPSSGTYVDIMCEIL